MGHPAFIAGDAKTGQYNHSSEVEAAGLSWALMVRNDSVKAQTPPR